MADNNVIKFRRIQKKPAKQPQSSRQAASGGQRLPAGRLSLIAWAVIVAAAVLIVLIQRLGITG